MIQLLECFCSYCFWCACYQPSVRLRYFYYFFWHWKKNLNGAGSNEKCLGAVGFEPRTSQTCTDFGVHKITTVAQPSYLKHWINKIRAIPDRVAMICGRMLLLFETSFSIFLNFFILNKKVGNKALLLNIQFRAISSLMTPTVKMTMTAITMRTTACIGNQSETESTLSLGKKRSIW